MRQTLKDGSGNTLGYIFDVTPYRLELRDASGKTLGYFNPQLDQTFTASGRMVGYGNLLASLLNSD